jgi:phenylpropionate dioxygenase-like ring-hydroxylating dioxygenase large terminal subunit
VAAELHADGWVTMNSPAVFADLPAQRACWHPVAFASDVADGPAHADLLGEPLVVWRSADGAPRVMSDLCVHRGTALSLGWIQGDELVCAYHGWRYGADGRCVAIPQKEDPAVVPAKARVRAFRVQERYGLIWVALEQPRWPLPEVPELENGEWVIVAAGPYRWRCDAARQVENFTDFGHFPWVHPGLLGDPQLQHRPARPSDPRIRRHDLRPGPGRRGITTTRARAVRPGRRTSPAFRCRRGRIPQGHA